MQNRTSIVAMMVKELADYLLLNDVDSGFKGISKIGAILHPKKYS